MASLRRNRATGTDGATPRFLYTILKQLDLKSIDWNDVAGNLDITNGHAARMRFSRFKQQMEGIQPPPRKPRSGPAHHKKHKQERPRPKSKVKTEKKPKIEDQLPIKSEPDESVGSVYNEPPLNTLYVPIKSEPITEGYGDDAGEMAWTALKSHQSPEENFPVLKMENETLDPSLGLLKVEEEPQMKAEPQWDP